MENRAELMALIEGDAQLAHLLEVVDTRMGDDPGHDVHHCLRVALWTVRVGGEQVDVRHAVAAALLHDLVNVPKDSADRWRASELSAAAASELLAAQGFTTAEVAEIAQAITDHSYSRGAMPRSPLGKALQDADRLEALGALGVFRTVSTGARMGASYFDPEDPWARARELDDVRFTVDHFFRKLLSLPETMHTPLGRAEARARVEFMHATLRQLGAEIGEAPPG